MAQYKEPEFEIVVCGEDVVTASGETAGGSTGGGTGGEEPGGGLPS